MKAYQDHEKKIKNAEEAVKNYLSNQSVQLAEILAHKISRYVAGAWKVLGPPKLGNGQAAYQEQLDCDLLERWTAYLSRPHQDYPYLKDWHALLSRGGSYNEAKQIGEELQQTVLSVLAEKTEVDTQNDLRLAPFKLKKNSADSALPNGFESYEEFCPGCDAELKALPREKFVLWKDLFEEQDAPKAGRKEPGVLRYSDETVERFLRGEWQEHLAQLRAELEVLKNSKSQPYPFLHGVRDVSQPHNIKTNVRGNPNDQGEEVPRRFPLVLSSGEVELYKRGSGRLQLAEAIASASFSGESDREPGMDVPFRPRPGGYSQQLWAERRPAQPSGTSRLPGRLVGEGRHVAEETASPDHALGDLSARC